MSSDSGSVIVVSKSTAIASDMSVSEVVWIDAAHEFTAKSVGARLLFRNATSKKPIRDSAESTRIEDVFRNGFLKALIAPFFDAFLLDLSWANRLIKYTLIV